MNDIEKHVKRFLFLILIVILVFIVFPMLAMILNEKRLLCLAFGVPTFLLGMVLFKYPFATPETTHKWGLKRSVTTLKIIGITLIIIGIMFQIVNLLLRDYFG